MVVSNYHFEMFFSEKLEIVDGPVNQTGRGPFQLDCGFKGAPAPAVMWYKDGRILGKFFYFLCTGFLMNTYY